MNKTENVNVRITAKDKKFLEDSKIRPTDLFRDALAKAKRRAKNESKKRMKDFIKDNEAAIETALETPN